MNKKTLIRYLSMLPLFIGLLLSACSSSNNDRAEDKSGISDNRVEVIYFHGNMRCLTCKAIEKFAKETVDSMYPDEVKMESYYSGLSVFPIMKRWLMITRQQDLPYS